MDELVRAADTLSSLVRSCFGPCAQEALLFAPPDPPLITADGHALLAAWRRGLRENRSRSDQHEPIQAFILDAAQSLFVQIGDGTSEFVLLVHSVVRHAVDTIRRGRSQWSAELSTRQLATAFGALKRECEQLLLDYPAWQPDLRANTPISFVHSGDGDLQPSREFRDATVKILQSGLSGLLGEQTLAFLIELVVDWIFTPPLAATAADAGAPRHRTVDAQLLFVRVQQFLKRAPDMVTFALAASLFGSQVVPTDEFILRKALIPSQMPSTLSALRADSASSAGGLVRFVCFTCELSLTSGANHVTIRTDTTEELFSAADATRLFIAKYLMMLRQTRNVCLIVCTEQVEDSVAAICTRLGIACVQLAEKSDVFDLCAGAKVYPLASLFDEIQEHAHIGICSGGVASVRLQQSANLWFRGLVSRSSQDSPARMENEQRAAVVVVPQLLLKAPTKGVYKQYFRVVVKALRILQSWWEPSCAREQQQQQSRFEVYSCRGGGVTELAIARHLDAQARADAANRKSTALQVARTIFASALRDVVVVLRSNMDAMAASSPLHSDPLSMDENHSRASKRMMLQDMARVALHDEDQQQRSDDSVDCSLPAAANALCGYVLDKNHRVETLVGAVCIPGLVFGDPQALGLLHPWRRIDALLCHTLETLEQLFRIDCIVSASASQRNESQPDMSVPHR